MFTDFVLASVKIIICKDVFLLQISIEYSEGMIAFCESFGYLNRFLLQLFLQFLYGFMNRIQIRSCIFKLKNLQIVHNLKRFVYNLLLFKRIILSFNNAI